MSEFSTGILHYHQIVDDIVAIAKSCVTADRIRENGHAERTNDQYLPLDAGESAAKQLLLSLTREQQNVLAKMLEAERIAACHDVLAELEWRHTAGGMDIFVDNELLPKEPNCATFHYAFMARLNGVDWPAES